MLFIDLVISSSFECVEHFRNNPTDDGVQYMTGYLNDKLQSIQTALDTLTQTRMRFFDFNEFELCKGDAFMFEYKTTEVTNQFTAAIESILAEAEQQKSKNYKISKANVNVFIGNQSKRDVLNVEFECILKKIETLELEINFVKINFNQFYNYIHYHGMDVARLEEIKTNFTEFKNYEKTLKRQRQKVNSLKLRINQVMAIS